MNLHELLRELREDNRTKIVLLVADGLGGLPLEPGGKTELETARTPHLDALVREGTCGLSVPVLPGITPGRGPGHLGLFGYHPLEYRRGRGIRAGLREAAQAGNRLVAAARRVLAGRAPTTGVTRRGSARYPKVATMQEIYGLRAAASGGYPMYKGLARLVGMDVAEAGSSLGDQM